MISIKKTTQPKIKLVKMTCDKPIHKKLEKYEMINDCFNHSHITLVCGRQGSGKTTIVTSLFKYVLNGVFENIYVIMPKKSFDDIVDNPFKKWLEDDEIFYDLDAEVLDTIHDSVKANCEAKETSAIIMDDFQRLYKDKTILKGLQKFITEVRHLNCSLFSLQQNFQKCPKFLRELAFNVLFFDLGKSQNFKIFDEIFNVNKEIFQKITQLFKKKGDFICINTHSNRIYFNYDEIIINDELK